MQKNQKPFAYWLVPEKETCQKLAQIINSLAKQTQSPPFEPHLTLYFGAYTSHNTVQNIAQELSQATSPIALQVAGIKKTPAIFKSLFIQFLADNNLFDMVNHIEQHLNPPENFHLDPHLSLMYADLSDSQKQTMIDNLTVNLATIVFDSLKLVTPNPVTQDWGDIVGWQIEGEWKLTGGTTIS